MAVVTLSVNSGVTKKSLVHAYYNSYLLLYLVFRLYHPQTVQLLSSSVHREKTKQNLLATIATQSTT